MSGVLARLTLSLSLLLAIIQVAGCGGVTGAANEPTTNPGTPTAPTAPTPPPTTPTTPPSTSALAGIFRYKIDLAGTGANLNETTLNLSNVNANSFGRLMQKGLDGLIFAQPLYVANLSINGGTHNVLYVATEHDIVYALDADTLTVLWTRNFTDPANGVTDVANANDGKGRTFLGPTVGITGTPVIDPTSQTLYVSAMTSENGTIKHKLHAISILDGTEKPGSPTEFVASVPGTGIGNDGKGNIPFLPEPHNQRAGLLLVNGVVYVTFASYSDIEPYHGWIFAVDASSMKILAVMNVTPSTEGGGIWQSGAAPAADAEGNIYLQTGDGEFTMNAGGKDIGDSTLKLHLNGNSLDLVDWFTPFNQDCLNRGDLDYGAGGPMLLPDQAGPVAHLLVTGTKEGRIYLLNRDSLGHFSASGSNPQIPQDLLINPAPCGQTSNDSTFRMYGTPTFWNGTVYIGSVFSGVRAFSLANAHLTQTGITSTVIQANGQAGRGVVPIITANGSTQGILWFVEPHLDHSIVLHAYDAANLSHELFNTNQNAGRDALGNGAVFIVPTIINGKAYVTSGSTLNMYGLLH